MIYCGYAIAAQIDSVNEFVNIGSSAKADVQAAYQRHEKLIQQARQAQISGGYKPDNFEVTLLKKGDKVYRVCVDDKTLCQGSWYTTKENLEKCNYRYDDVYDGVQISKDGMSGQRYKIAEYEVQQDIYVPTGEALNNTIYGKGGFIQYFIYDWEKYINFDGILYDLIDIP